MRNVGLMFVWFDQVIMNYIHITGQTLWLYRGLKPGIFAYCTTTTTKLPEPPRHPTNNAHLKIQIVFTPVTYMLRTNMNIMTEVTLRHTY